MKTTGFLLAVYAMILVMVESPIVGIAHRAIAHVISTHSVWGMLVHTLVALP